MRTLVIGASNTVKMKQQWMRGNDPHFHDALAAVDVVFVCIPGDASVSGHDEYR